MKAPQVSLVPTASLTETLRAGVDRVFRAAFQVPPGRDDILSPYFAKFGQVLLVTNGAELLAFQFYRHARIGARDVHHFSLAACLPDSAFRGVQRRIGRFLIGHAILSTPPTRPLYLAGVTNSSRSYANMYAIGRTRFPDILDADAANPFGDYYVQVADQLGLPRPDARGILPGRMQQIGFSLRRDLSDGGKLANAYLDYVGGDVDQGVFTLVRVVPLADVPRYLLRQLARYAGSRGAGRGTAE